MEQNRAGDPTTLAATTEATSRRDCWLTNQHRLILPMQQPLLCDTQKIVDERRESSDEKSEWIQNNQGNDSNNNSTSHSHSNIGIHISASATTATATSMDTSSPRQSPHVKEKQNTATVYSNHNNTSHNQKDNRSSTAIASACVRSAPPSSHHDSTSAARAGGGGSSGSSSYPKPIRSRGPHPSETPKRREHPKLHLGAAITATPQLSAPASAASPRNNTLRTNTSANSTNNNGAASPSPAHSQSYSPRLSVPSLPPPLECDYDTSPTTMYKLIEAKQWDLLLERIQADALHPQAETWVIRKDPNGKLRWRLLPLHAAIIFRAPLVLVEAILEAYPLAASCKDDQGMVPLHLAFKHFHDTTNDNHDSQWQILEELLTHYPAAVDCKDRKGRTPLQTGLQTNNQTPASLQALQMYSSIVAASSSRQQNITTNANGNRSVPSTPVSAASSDMNNNNNAEVAAQLSTVRAQHVATLEDLRRTFLGERNARQAQHGQEMSLLQRQLEQSRVETKHLRNELEHARQAATTATVSVSATAARDQEPLSSSSGSPTRNLQQLQEQNEQLQSLLASVLANQTKTGASFRDEGRRQEDLVDTYQARLRSIGAVGPHATTAAAPLTLTRSHSKGSPLSGRKCSYDIVELNSSAPASLDFGDESGRSNGGVLSLPQTSRDKRSPRMQRQQQQQRQQQWQQHHRRSLADEMFEDMDSHPSLDNTFG